MARPLESSRGRNGFPGLFGNGLVSPDILLSEIERQAPLRERRPLALFRLEQEIKRSEKLQSGATSQPARQRAAIPGGSPAEIYPGGPTKGEIGIPDIIHPIQAGSPTRPVAPPLSSPELAPTSMILGAVGTLFSSGFLTDLQEYNAQFIGRNAFPIYDKMRRTCSDVAALEAAIALPVAATEWQVVPGADPADTGYQFAAELADMVRENLFGGLEAPLRTGGHHSQTWASVVRNALLASTFGCSAHEMCWDVDRDRVRITALVPRLPITFYRWWVDYDGYTLLAMEQLGYRRNEFANVIVPAQKLSTFAVNKEGANFFGRALALDTPIPTLNGWKTIKDLEVGECIFGEDGNICHVTGKSSIWRNRPCFRLIFSNRTSIIADANHEWPTQTLKERQQKKTGSLRKTMDIAASVESSYAGVANHAIRKCGALDYPRQLNLPIPPYLLGLWLGDGTSIASNLSCYVDDAEHYLIEARRCGYEATVRRNGKAGGKGRCIHLKGLITQLRGLGLYANKHIPQAYLRGDIEQRRALLAGLMDSDGTVSPLGYSSFTNTNQKLIEGVEELLTSLGEVPNVIAHPAGKYGRITPGWEVTFRTYTSPFRLSRKTKDILAANKRKWNEARHYIRVVQAVENQDTMCIEVDSPSHLYLAGKGCIPTHNSIFRAAYMNFYYLDFLTRIDGIACEHSGVGVPVIEQTEPGVASPKDVESCKNFVTKLAANENLGINLPYGFKFSQKGVEGKEHSVIESMRYHAAKIYMTGLAGHLNLAERVVGSYGMSESLADFFSLSENLLAEMIAEEINLSVVRRLVDYNYEIPHALRVDKMPYPLLKPARIAVLNFPMLLDKLRYAAQDNVDLIHPDDKLETWLRGQMGAPPPENPRPRYRAITQTEREILPAAPGEMIPQESPEGPDSGDSQDGQVNSSLRLGDSHRHAETFALPDKFPPYSRTGLNKIDKRGQMKAEERLAKEIAAEFRLAKGALIASAREHAGRMRTLADRDRFGSPGITPEIARRVKEIIRRAMTYGHDSVYRERFRATGRRRNSPVLQLREMRLQDASLPESLPKRTPEEIAALAAAEAEGWMVVKARNLMLEALRRGLAGDLASAFVGDEFDAAPDGALDAASLRAARDGVQMGRLEAYRALAPEIAKLLRREMGDDRVCAPCDEHDGDTWDRPEDVDWWPGKDCLGGKSCRGDLVTIYADEGKYVSRP